MPREPGSALRAAGRHRPLKRWWLDRSIRVKGLIVIAAPLIALIGTTSASLVLQYNERQERSVALAASELSSAAGRVLADAVNAETSIRGYAAARNRIFLAPYDRTLTRIGAARTSLRNAATTDGATRLQRTADVTTGRVLSELAGLRSAISSGVSPKDLRPALENQETTMDLLRRQMSELAGAPAALLVTQQNKITRLETSIDRLDVAGLVLGVLAVLAGALFISDVSRRIAANAANADRLGTGQPLEPNIPSRDEIGSVADSLFQAAELLDNRSAQLTAGRDEALKAAQAKNAFLSYTSHELRTPLNAILGFTQLLQMSDLNSKDRDSAQHILTAGHHLLALINELIDTSRIESGDLSLSLEPVSVLPLMEEASLLLGPLAAERSIAIVHECAHPGLAAQADRQRFAQVLVNLISNAVKYNRHGGTITISGQEKGPSQVTVVVSDTGRGITQEDLERIFLPFERLGAGETSIEGTGIGLPLARALTQAMGGQLTVSSVPGQGSAFTVTLPRAPDPIHIPSHPAGPAAPARGATRILYIEDNPANVEVLSQFLKTRLGTTMRSAASGREGIACAVRDVPDLILLDLHLPDLHGGHVLNELKAGPVTAGIPVVVLSADATPGVIRRLLAGGAISCLSKPLDLVQLDEVLESLPPLLQTTTPTVRPEGNEDELHLKRPRLSLPRPRPRRPRPRESHRAVYRGLRGRGPPGGTAARGPAAGYRTSRCHERRRRHQDRLRQTAGPHPARRSPPGRDWHRGPGPAGRLRNHRQDPRRRAQRRLIQYRGGTPGRRFLAIIDRYIP
jgi:signal transduction histidine kinase/ActR/RegA family two-component response regulator